jgi:glycosyltransferase involved in cell wall biosynthesis
MPVYRLGFVMEQTLGHITHDKNLRHWVAQDSRVVPEWMPIEFRNGDKYDHMPLVRGNWSLRASLRARKAVEHALATQPLDGLFFHTQVTSLFSHKLMRFLPSIVSLDATPMNVDMVGAAYGHKPSRNPVLEAFKNALNRRAYRRARHLVTWCEWAKDSLVKDYRVPDKKVTVIPPGIDLGKWHFERYEDGAKRPVRLLFVGGDFVRKGGEVLMEAFRDHLEGCAELDIVTRDPVDVGELQGVRVHHGLTSNHPDLLALYEQADIFVFPTLGDCLPIAVMEAMAAELPVVATTVGALDEQVEEGETGYLVRPEDSYGLAACVTRMIEDPDLRRQLGYAGRKQAQLKFNGRGNYGKLIEVFKGVADGKL